MDRREFEEASQASEWLCERGRFAESEVEILLAPPLSFGPPQRRSHVR